MAGADAPTIARQAAEIAELQRQLGGLRREAETASKFLNWLNLRGGLGIDVHNTLDLVLTSLNGMIEEIAVDNLAPQRKLQVAAAAEAYWQRKHDEAWILLGRVDFAAEQAVRAKGIRDARAWAARARDEIKAAQPPRKSP